MPADPRDDFGELAANEHMLFGLADPYRMIRDETEAALRRQVSDTEIESIVCAGTPKYLTLGKQVDGGTQVRVTFFGFCVRARVALTYNAGRDRDELDTALTFLFGRVDEPDHQVSTMHFDLHADADRAFDDAVFHDRFIAFRARYAAEPDEA